MLTASKLVVVGNPNDVQLSFPEGFFLSFPGMGALSALFRRCDPSKVNEILDVCFNGHIYEFTNQQLLELGVKLWAEHMLNLPDEAIEVMGRLVRAQGMTIISGEVRF